jgi:hypothetical protein
MGSLFGEGFLGFNFPTLWQESPLNFTYDLNTGYLESGGYTVFAQKDTPRPDGPLTLVTFLEADVANVSPIPYPVVCTVLVGPK